MHCEQVRDEFADYLAGTLDALTRRTVEVHIAGCEDCRTAAEVWAKMGELSMERPSPMVRARFQDFLTANVASPRVIAPRASMTARPWLAWAAAAAVAIGAFLAGRYSPQLGNRGEDVATLRQEVRDLREAVVVGMLKQASASDRLRGVLSSATLERPDSDVINALIETMRTDTNVNVRLSAIDALKKFSGEAAVRRSFAQALPKADSPLVQIALIDALVESRDAQAPAALRQLAGDAQAEQIVKTRARLALERLQPIEQ